MLFAEIISKIGFKDLVALVALVVSFASLLFTVWKGRIDQRVGVKPALVFVYDRDAGWQLQNIGSGPALNVVVAWKEHGQDAKPDQWVRPVRIPPLRKDGVFSIHWDRDNNTHGLGATYEDIWDRPYSTTCGNDLNSVRPGNTLRKWRPNEIVAEWTLRRESQ
jgi:hypothetical protein